MMTSPHPTIHVNGKARTVPHGLTVEGLLRHLELEPRLVVVERNRAILARDRYAEEAVAAGDRFELVQFVGGG